ncbi:TetR/AcrR family transcriptional regulator [Paracoccus alkanivorans]|uniref:TetR/AcrR family transcriptional regulator n=1 Tax=Paracoccus alkanivorans TaxID=2116655 RepID=A0A3M0M1H6_9RHOB|nr:TetR/AcrR family transcriptional regulator [Paracoccus alkanivorans]RMC31622.1 TetR/AcrR family transcriptional regulator [Paracoccus alkanivorans]
MADTKLKQTGEPGDCARTALPGNVKVTREDWLSLAMKLLVSHGVSEVKVLSIGNRLGVSRSSFYWYFKSREDLLNQLLGKWEQTNTGVLIDYSQREAATITEAVTNFFRCIVVPGGFDHRLDFAVREWARRDKAVRQVIDRSDTARHEALMRMYERFGYPPKEADIRARVLYYQQIGYYALELSETLEDRLSRVEGYLYCFTGVHPSRKEVEDFLDFARNAGQT